MHTILTILWRDDRDYGVHYVAKSQLVEKWKTRTTAAPAPLRRCDRAPVSVVPSPWEADDFAEGP